MYKNRLQEVAQRSCFNLPSYVCIREGPDHAPKFKASVNFNGELFESPNYCSTIRQAEHAAAQVALSLLSIRGSRFLTAKVLDETGVYKNLLQETTHKAGLSLPLYTTELQRSGGPGHNLHVFTCTVDISGLCFTGEPAKTKKQAEKNAAAAAWSALKKMSSCFTCPLSKEGGREEDNEEAGQEQVIVQRVLSGFRPPRINGDSNNQCSRRAAAAKKRRVFRRQHHTNKDNNRPSTLSWPKNTSKILPITPPSSEETSSSSSSPYCSLSYNLIPLQTMPSPPPITTMPEIQKDYWVEKEGQDGKSDSSKNLVVGKEELKITSTNSATNPDHKYNHSSQLPGNPINKYSPSSLSPGVIQNQGTQLENTSAAMRYYYVPRPLLSTIATTEGSSTTYSNIGTMMPMCTQNEGFISRGSAPAVHMRTMIPVCAAPAVRIRTVIPVCSAPPSTSSMRPPRLLTSLRPPEHASSSSSDRSPSSSAALKYEAGEAPSSSFYQAKNPELCSTKISYDFNKLKLGASTGLNR